MIAVMPTAVVAVVPTALTNVPATMPGVPAAVTAVATPPATGVSLAPSWPRPRGDCHAADQADVDQLHARLKRCDQCREPVGFVAVSTMSNVTQRDSQLDGS
jgi:hypothetical protein